MTSTLPHVSRRDLLPENVKWRDTGCADGGPSCLACPLDVCLLDQPSGADVMRGRNRRILRAHKEGRSVKKIAAAFGLSTRTVHRVIQTGGVVRLGEPDPDEAPLLSISELNRRQYVQPRKPWPVLLENRGSR